MGRSRAAPAHWLRAGAASFLVALTIGACTADTNHITGRVLSVEGEGLAVTGFVLVGEGGSQIRFAVDPAADRIEFPLIHLRDHLLSGEPVSVTYEEREMTVDQAPAVVRVAVRVEDA